MDEDRPQFATGGRLPPARVDTDSRPMGFGRGAAKLVGARPCPRHKRVEGHGLAHPLVWSGWGDFAIFQSVLVSAQHFALTSTFPFFSPSYSVGRASAFLLSVATPLVASPVTATSCEPLPVVLGEVPHPLEPQAVHALPSGHSFSEASGVHPAACTGSPSTPNMSIIVCCVTEKCIARSRALSLCALPARRPERPWRTGIITPPGSAEDLRRQGGLDVAGDVREVADNPGG